MNPFYGRALERDRLRAAGSENTEPEVVSASDASDGHWVTIDHRHVLVHERQGNRPRMALSAKGLDFIRRHEGLRLAPYRDQAGNLTIGYGHEIQASEDYSRVITRQQANALLEKDVQDAVTEVNAALARPVTQNQFDALVDLASTKDRAQSRKATS